MESGAGPAGSDLTDADKVDALLDHWRARIRHTCRNLLGNDLSARADTSDVAQEGILQAWQDLGVFRGSTEQQFDAWTRRIGSGHAAKIRRHHLAEKRSAGLEQAHADEPVDRSQDPAQAAEQRETQMLLAESLENLQPELKVVVLLRIFENATFREIADRLSLPRNTVQSRFARAISQLHSMLAGR